MGTPIHWTKSINGDFATAADWTGGVVPGSGDDAYLDAPAIPRGTVYSVTVSAGETENVEGVDLTQAASLVIDGGYLQASRGTDGGANAGTISLVDDGANITSFAFGETLVNTGKISLGSTGHAVRLLISGADGTLSGGGTVTLSDQSDNFISSDGSGVQSFVNLNNTISGAGFIGGYNSSSYLAITNSGVIDASGSKNALRLDASSTIQNSGLIEATGAGGLDVGAGSIANTGVIEAGGGSGIGLISTHIDGGSLTVSAGGYLTTAGTSSFDGGAFTNQGETTVQDSSYFVLADETITNTGGKIFIADGSTIGLVAASIVSGALYIEAGATLTVGPFGAGVDASLFDNRGKVFDGSYLALEGSIINSGSIVVAYELVTQGVTLSGAGSVQLGGTHDSDYISGSTLTNFDNTLSGYGAIKKLNLTNDAQGVIDATSAKYALVINTGGEAVHNSGLIEGTGKAGLEIQSTTVSGAGGVVMAGSGSNVTLSDSRIDGGTLATAAGGTINIDNASLAEVQGTITNAGMIALASTGSKTDLYILAAGATLTGAGTIALSGSASRIYGVAASTTLTNVNNRIDGSGLLGAGKLTLVNEQAGVIEGNGATALTLNTGAVTISNAGYIEAVGQGAVIVDSAVNNTGKLYADGGTLTLEGAVTGAGAGYINGGTLDAAGAFSESVKFLGTGVLELADSQAYTGKIAGFSTSGTNSLDLLDIAFGSKTKATYSGSATLGTLTVTNGTHTAKFILEGNYTTSTFSVSSDGHGGAKVIDPATAGAAHAFTAAMASFGGGDAAVMVPDRGEPYASPMLVPHGGGGPPLHFA